MTQHGFARSQEFEVVKWNPSELVFSLKSTPETFLVYPFHFDFRLGFRLEENRVIQSFEVINTDSQSIPFSFGGHPAFIADPIDDHYLEFECDEDQMSQTVEAGIRTAQTRNVFEQNRIQLSQTVFDHDALIFKSLKSKRVILRNKAKEALVAVDFDGFPFLGIWAKPGANFVCIEPWCGIADSAQHNLNIFEKEGIQVLEVGNRVERRMQMTFG
jgi:galactose mutarotase-like enzyme